MRLAAARALSVVAVALACTGANAQSPGVGQYLATEIQLRAERAGDGEQLELVESDLRLTKPRRRAVTDFLLRLNAQGGAIDLALQAPNDTSGGRSRPLMQAELYLIVSGRIEGPFHAACERWRSDSSLCRLDCDGGAFVLRRGARYQLTLVIAGAGTGDGAERPVLNACRAGEAEVSLAPRGGGAALAIPLAAR